jgi:acyl-coenzyme A synthetase/AMP-(fatty) acid ligase
MRVDQSGRAAPVSAHPGLPRVLSGQARRFRDRLFLVEGATGRHLTYGDLHQRSVVLGAQVRGRGIGPGDAVLVAAGNTLEYVLAAFALMHAGAIMIPLNPRAEAGELGAILRHSAAVALVTTERAAGGLPSVGSLPVILVDADALAATRGVPVLPAVAAEPDHPVVVLYTSGSTGAPKGVELGVRSQLADHGTYVRQMRFDPTLRLLQMMPGFHADGWGYTLLIPFLAGISVVLTEPFDARVCAGFERYVREYGANVPVAMPSILSTLARARGRFKNASGLGLRYALTSSEKLTEDAKRAFTEAFGSPVLDFYGITECGLISYYREDTGWSEGCVGPLHPGVEVRFAPDGELLVRSPYLFNGYYRDPQRTAAALDGDWYRTGDLGAIDGDGRLWLKGRKTSIIDRAGVRVPADDIDRVLRRDPDVEDVCTVGVPDPRVGEEVYAFVVLKQPPADGALSGVLAHCRAHLEPSRRPRVVVLDAMPRNRIGKIDRLALRDLGARAQADRPSSLVGAA